MNASKRRLASNALSVLLAVALIMGSIPFYGLFSFAASGNFSIQVVESGIVAENVSCSFSNSSDVAVSGSTSTNGVWKTGYSLGSSSDESFTFSVGGKSFTATPTDTFLIYDRADETYSFADHAVVNIITVNISSIKNNDTVKFTESPSAAALGLPIKARAMFSDGSSSDLDLTWDLGDYKTDDYDGFNFDAVATVETGGLKAVPGVSIKNTYSLQCSPAADPEILFSGAKTKTISKGDSITLSPEVSGYVSRYVWYKDNHEISGINSKDYTIASATISDSGTYKVKAVGKNGISVKTTSGITLTVKEDKMTGISLDAYYNGEKLEAYQLSRPVSGEIKLKVSGYPDNCTFTYHVNDEVITSVEAEYTFEVTDTVDSYNCFVEIKSSKQYSDSTVSIPQITIGKSAQDSVSIVFPEAVKNSNYKLVYTEGSKFDVKLTGGTEGSFTLESSDPSVAAVTQKSDDTWTVSIVKTGNFVLRAGRSGTDDYAATAPYTKMITVTKAPLASFGFDAEEYETVYNSNNNEFSKTIDGYENVKYEIIGSTGVAEIDPDTGIVSIIKAGRITVKASVEANENYSAAEDEYILTIQKANQYIRFEDLSENATVDEDGNVHIYYGQSLTRKAEAVKSEDAADGYGYAHNEDGEAEIRYSVSAPEGEEAIASINEDGELDFSDHKTGSITIIAELPGDDCYNAAMAFIDNDDEPESPEEEAEAGCKYTLFVDEYTVTDGYTLSGEGDTDKNDSGWFNKNVRVTPAEGYTISISDSIKNNDWEGNVTVSDEGENQEVSFYLRNQNEDSPEYGAISTKIIENISIDKKAPESVNITYSLENWYEEILEGITFKVFSSSVAFTISAEDTVSGVDHFNWYFATDTGSDGSDNPQLLSVAENSAGRYISEPVTIGDGTEFANRKGRIGYSATDVAGNSSDYECDYVITDSEKAQLSISVVNAEPVNTVDVVAPYADSDKSNEYFDIFDKNIEVKLSIIEKNFIEERALVKVNEENQENLTWETDGDNHLCTISLNEDGDYTIALEYTDLFREANSAETLSESRNIVVDTAVPDVRVTLSEPSVAKNGVSYYNSSPEITFTVKEEKFRPSDFSVAETEGKTGIGNPADWSYADGLWTSKIVLDAFDGNYGFNTNYKDLAGHEIAQIQNEFIIDVTPATAEINGGEDRKALVENSFPYNNVEENGIEIFSDETGFNFIITEQNFFENDAEVTVNGKKENVDWVTESNSHKATFNCADDGDYDISVKYTDVFGEVVSAHRLVCIDTQPAQIEIELTTEPQNTYDNAGYYNSEVTAAITVKEAKFRPDELNFSIEGTLIGLTDEQIVQLKNPDSWTYDESKDEYKAEVIFPAAEDHTNDGEYKFSVKYTDLAGNEMQPVSSQRFIIDTVSPEDNAIDYPQSKSEYFNGQKTYLYYDADTSFTIKSNDPLSGVKNVDWKYNKANGASGDNVDSKTGNFTSDTPAKEFSENITLDGDQYKGSLTFDSTDFANNTSSYSDDKVVVIDTVNPEIGVPPAAQGTGISFASENFDLKIDITDDNFDKPGTGAEKLKIEVLKKQDISGTQDGNIEAYENKLNQLVSDSQNWNSGSVTIVIEEEAVYQFRITATDRAGNTSTLTTCVIVVDKSKPYDISIEYPDPVTSKTINGSTYLYYNAVKPFTVEATDSVSGVSQIDWKFTKTAKSSASNKESASGTITFDVLDSNMGADRTETGTITLANGQYNGSFSLTVMDRPGNTEEYSDKNIVVIDSVKPTIAFELSEAVQAVDSSGSTVADFDYTAADNGSKLYYSDSATATIKITEANFYPEDVEITVNGEKYEVSGWKQSGDEWTGEIKIESEGHYVIEAKYTDRSGNKMDEFKSNEIIIDGTDPTLSVVYSPDDVVYTDGDRKYYNKPQKATITIVEHNFRASDVDASVTAVDINGSPITVDDFAQYLKSDSAWSNDGDTHTATIEYSTDANYTFTIGYTDLTLKTTGEYGPDYFTFDTTPPQNITIKYSKSVIDTVIEGISFGYYNAPVVVTISAQDDISGVNNFIYSYVKAPGTSDVNTERQNVKLNVSKNTNGNSGAAASFELPPNGQFNGTVRAKAVDKAGNVSSEVNDRKRIVVDTISPTGSITLSPPVSTNSGVNYYNSPANAIITINEANFDSNDVVVTLNGSPLKTSSWTKNGDVYTSNATVSSDGVYSISVSCTDKSSNTMSSFGTGEFMIDHTRPSITLRGVANEKAYKSDNVGFTLTVADTNIIGERVKATLAATVRNKDGNLETKNINLGAPLAVENGRTYIYNVSNLDEDGIYTLNCSATDLCSNSTSIINVADSGGAQLDTVTFSINRNGSTYKVSDRTQKFINESYYKQSVNENIVITETNVNPLTDYVVKVNDRELVEGKDYTVTKTEQEGGWYKYDYSINPDVFEEEDEYNIVISSLDGTETRSYSDIKGSQLSFVVDSTAPQVMVSGLENNGTYQTSKQTVTVIPTDDGGKIESLKVVITDKNGKVIDDSISYSEEQIAEILKENDGMLTFDISENPRPVNIKVTCTDKAGNSTDAEYRNVTISSSKLQILWASNAFKSAVIGCPLAVAAGAFLLVFLKKKKKKDEEAEADI